MITPNFICPFNISIVSISLHNTAEPSARKKIIGRLYVLTIFSEWCHVGRYTTVYNPTFLKGQKQGDDFLQEFLGRHWKHMLISWHDFYRAFLIHFSMLVSAQYKSSHIFSCHVVFFGVFWGGQGPCNVYSWSLITITRILDHSNLASWFHELIRDINYYFWSFWGANDNFFLMTVTDFGCANISQSILVVLILWSHSALGEKQLICPEISWQLFWIYSSCPFLDLILEFISLEITMPANSLLFEIWLIPSLTLLAVVILVVFHLHVLGLTILHAYLEPFLYYTVLVQFQSCKKIATPSL